MARYKLIIEYDGGPFCGWQRSGEGLMSVQGALEDAVWAFCQTRTDVTGAGRTDAGVHALAQVAHVDLPSDFRADTVRDALNAHLRPHPVAVLAVHPAPDDFHARFSAVRRRYRYRIINRRADLTLDRGRAWRIGGPLDAGVMAEAGARLVGRHDFTTFRDAQCQAQSPIKTLDVCDVTCTDDRIDIVCVAPSFLHRQVRSIVGTLAEAGAGRRTPDGVGEDLAARDRRRCGAVAPACGLYLEAVDYPANATS
jgi:tRNA pseudouridine38-40 synthase